MPQVSASKAVTFSLCHLSLTSQFHSLIANFPIPCRNSHEQIGPFQASSGEKARVKVKFELNLHGIVTVTSAMLIQDHQKTDKTEVDSSTFGSSTMGENGNEEDTSMNPRSSDDAANDASKDKTNRRLEIPVNERIYGGMTKSELSEAQEKELRLAEHDRSVEHAKDQKNALESYVYEMRNKLFNTYQSFASERERDGISRSLQETEEWLYEDGDDELENAYASKLQYLQKLVDPIEIRYKDEEARAQAARNLLNRIENYGAAGDSLPHEDRALIFNECNKAELWLRDRSQQQVALPRNADPALWSSEIRSRTEDLNATFNHILRKNTSSHSAEDCKGRAREV